MTVGATDNTDAIASFSRFMLPVTSIAITPAGSSAITIGPDSRAADPAALARPGQVFARGVLDYASAQVSSAFDLAPRVSVLPDGLQIESRLAHRDGSALESSNLVRSFRIGGGALEVEERLVDAGGATAVEYHVPSGARQIVREAGHVRYLLGS